jgi:hypothetical protein
MPQPLYTPLTKAKDVDLYLKSNNLDKDGIRIYRLLLIQKAKDLQENLNSDLLMYNVPYQTPNWVDARKAIIQLVKLMAIAPTSELLRHLDAPDFVVNEMKQRECGIRYEEYANEYMKVFNMNDKVRKERCRRELIADDLQQSLTNDSRIYNVPYKTPNWYTERESEIAHVKLDAQAPTSEILRYLGAPPSVVYEMQIREEAAKSQRAARLPHPTVRM